MYQYPDYLMHYGVPGMKWGVRKQRVTSGKTNRRSAKSSMSEEDKKARRRRNMKIAAGVAGVVLAAYGAHKFKDFVNDTNRKYHDELGQKKVKEFTERYERLADNTYSRAQKQARDRLKSGRNTPDQYRYNITSATRMNAQRHFAAGNSHYLRPDSLALLDAAERHASKVNKKKHEIWLREFKKQKTDSFPQAVKNTATYYKDRKRKRR
nr:MAG TPA: Structural protein [Caudoviricetes sp.]